MTRGNAKITDMFSPKTTDSPATATDRVAINEDPKVQLLKLRLDDLKTMLRNTKNKMTKDSKLAAYDVHRYNCVHIYITYLLEGKKKMIASQLVAKYLCKKETKYMSEAIRNWAKTFKFRKLLRNTVKKGTQSVSPCLMMKM